MMRPSGPTPPTRHGPPQLNWLRRPRWAAALAVAVLLVAATQSPDQDPTAPFPRAGVRAGQDWCIECHEEQLDALADAIHRDVAHGDAAPGCETCHGPGHDHADDEDNDPRLITHPRRLRPAAQTAVCRGCHGEQIDGHGGDPEGFVAAGKGCTACHTVHEPRPETPFPKQVFRVRGAAAAASVPVGASRCLECHPLQEQRLAQGLHHGLAAEHDRYGCERCHGNGSRHVETSGLARLITRPDTARDGVATCRQCHSQVHPSRFHWTDRPGPAAVARDDLHDVPQGAPPGAAAAARASPGGDRSGDRQRGAAPTNRLCATCHAPAFDVLRGTIHEQLGGLDTPLSLGCASCHAGAEVHARNGGRAHLVDSMRGTTARHQQQVCTQCHGREPSLRHHKIGSHHRRGVSCLSCHSPAAPRGAVRRDAESKCAQCHAAVRRGFPPAQPPPGARGPHGLL